MHKKMFHLATVLLIVFQTLLLAIAPTVLGAIAFADTSDIPSANVDWVRILKDSVYLYKDEACSQKLFLLEQSYYLKILDEQAAVYCVAIMPNDAGFRSFSGFVRKGDVSACATDPLIPYYPSVKLTVTDNVTDIMAQPTPNADSFISAMYNQQVNYYGKIEYYGTWYFVDCFGIMGYVKASEVSKPNVSLHPTPMPTQQTTTTPTTPSEDPSPTPNNDKEMPTSELVLIVFVVLLAVGLTLALFLPGNVNKKHSVFEQDI